MHQQVADGHLAGDPRVVHLEVRQMIDYLVVPTDLALIDEDGERCDRDGLAGRAGRKNRVRIDAIGLPECFDTEAFGEDDPIVLDDRDGHPGHADLRACRFRTLLETRGWGSEGERREL